LPSLFFVLYVYETYIYNLKANKTKEWYVHKLRNEEVTV